MLPLLGGHRTPRQGILIHQRYFSLSAHIYKYGRQYKTIMKIRLISAGLVLGALLSTSAFAQAPAAATADQTGAAVSKAGKKVKDTAEEGTKKVSKKVKGAPTQNASAAEIADAKTNTTRATTAIIIDIISNKSNKKPRERLSKNAF